MEEKEGRGDSDFCPKDEGESESGCGGLDVQSSHVG